MMAMPMTAVMSPPVRNDTQRGARFENRWRDDIGAMLVESVAMASAIIARTMTTGGDCAAPPAQMMGRTGSAWRCDGDADEGEQRHRRRQTDAWPDLIALAARETR